MTTYYDPILAKVIAHGDSREEAIRRLDYALSQIQLLGVRSNIGFLRRVLNHPDFIAGNIDTGFIESHSELLQEGNHTPEVVLIAAALGKTVGLSPLSPIGGYWRNNPYRPIKQTFRVGEKIYEVLITPKLNPARNDFVIPMGDHTRQVSITPLDSTMTEQVWNWLLEIDGLRQRVTVTHDDGWVHSSGGAHRLEWVLPLPEGKQSADSAGSLRAPMPGQVIKVDIKNGQRVKAGDILLVIEAMKMEHRIAAPYNGAVTAVHSQVGQSVEAGVKLLELEASE